MNAKRLLTIAVVSMLLVGGVAALGAATPADEANDSASGAGEDLPAQAEDAGADDDAEDGPEANGEGPGAAEKRGVGPSDGLPEQVPDHVRGIHDRIDSFLGGSIDDLGGSLSDLLGDGAAADDAADNAGDSESAGSTDNGGSVERGAPGS